MRTVLAFGSVVYALVLIQVSTPADVPWPLNGGVDNIRYSPLKEITRENVGKLQVAWTYVTHDEFPGSEMQANPIVVDGVLYATTPKLRVFALDAATGRELWTFDANGGNPPASRFRHRGVVVTGDRVLFTYRNKLWALDKKTGKRIWEKVIRTSKPATERHEKSSHANTTLITDGNRLIGFFGSEGLYCFDLNGKQLWTKDLGVIDNSWHGIGWGYSSSPAMYRDRIVLLCDDPKAPFVGAFSLADGKELWRTSRKGACVGSWGTPFIFNDGSRTQVVTNGWPYIVSYDLETGKELWRLKGGGDIPIPTPFVADGLIVVSNAHGGKAPLFAIRPTAKGDISLAEGATTNESIVWSVPNGGSYISTPVVYSGNIYLANFNGVMRCFDFKTLK